MSDVTFQLVRDGYFASLNVPWHEWLYVYGGYPELIKKLYPYGNYRSNDKGPRLMIVERDAKLISSFDDFRAFMRAN
jgi:hypothetical protein